MSRSGSRPRLWVLGAAGALAYWATLSGDTVPVRYTEGTVHGFLALRALDGTTIADGDLVQTASGNRVTIRLTFHFRDGSLYDDTAVYSQGREFLFLSDHLVQTGPTFSPPLDMTINGGGDVTVRYTNDRGEHKVETEHLDLPPDMANGAIPILLKNVRTDAAPKRLSFVAATPKPRLMRLVVSVAGQDRFSTGGTGRTATHYVLKVEIGGVAGLLAPLVGKQPPDSHVWILGGESPAFVKSEQPLFLGGPLWRIELVSPIWPQGTAASK